MPKRYDRARPTYPAELVDLAGIGEATRVLEIGPGTGQLTVALAKHRCRIVAVDLGAMVGQGLDVVKRIYSLR
ncbi:MAG: class I SAM-dependent methyltransferase [Pseudonocardiaceae bacterium]